MLNKTEIYNFLKEKNIEFEVTEHKAAYSMSDMINIEVPYPECDAKNLFIRDDKKRNYFLITVKGDKKVNLKEFRKQNNTRPLTFASELELFDILNLKAGSVSPFGLLNDKNLKVQFFIDKDFYLEPNLIGIHPNENTATVWLKTEVLISLIKEHGNIINTIEI